MIPEYSCDKWVGIKKSKPFEDGRCKKKPYCEVFKLGVHSWSYLCRWHFIIDIIYCKIFRIKTHGYFILNKNDEGDRFVD